MKQKATLIIRGNLVAKQIGGGGNLFSIQNEKFLERYFDTEGAITIDGDLLTDTFDAGQQVVVVLGAVTQEGGSHE